MKDPNDSATIDTLEAPRRGRPKTGKALTPAEKQRAYRDRKRNSGNAPEAQKRDDKPLPKELAEYKKALDQLTAERIVQERLITELRSQLEEQFVEKRTLQDRVWELEKQLQKEHVYS